IRSASDASHRFPRVCTPLDTFSDVVRVRRSTPGATRTRNRVLRRHVLYPVELRGRPRLILPQDTCPRHRVHTGHLPAADSIPPGRHVWSPGAATSPCEVPPSMAQSAATV